MEEGTLYELNGRMLGRGRGWFSQWGIQCVYVCRRKVRTRFMATFTPKWVNTFRELPHGTEATYKYLHTFDRNSIVMIYRSPFLIQFNMYRTHSYFTTGGGGRVQGTQWMNE